MQKTIICFGDIIPQDPTKDITFKRPDVSRSPGIYLQ